MKKYILVLMLSSLLLFGCGKKDDSQITTDSPASSETSAALEPGDTEISE